MPHLYRHNKTGHLYIRFFTWVNCNNGFEKAEFIYMRLNIFKCRMIFYRDVNEFNAKFTPLFHRPRER